MSAVRAVIWDLDGTMIDSSDDHYHAWRQAFAPSGFVLSRERFTAVFGRRPDEIVRALLGQEVSANDVVRIVDDKWQAYRERVGRRGVELLPGVREWVERLAGAGWGQAVASDGARWNIERVLEATGLARYFETVVCGQDVPHGKPDPAIFLTAASRLGSAPPRCVVLEDSPAGVEAARRAGMRVVGVLTAQESLTADVVVSRLSDLAVDVFERLLGGGPAG
jgi:beta-phosphoglucomutase